MISYSLMTTNDLKNLYNFASPIWFDCYKDIIPNGQIDLLTHKYFDYDNILKFQDNGMIYENVIYNDILCGFIVYQLYDEYIYLDKLYILIDFRGKHISSNSFDYLINKYNLPIRLNVNQGNKVGMRAYLGNGFKIIETKEYNLPNGYINCDYIMEKIKNN